MVVGLCTVELFISESRSLKDKRQVLHSLKDRLHGKFNLSVAEVDGQDLWQRGTVGVALVTTDSRLAQSMLDRITDGIGTDGEAELLSRRIEFFRPEGSESA